VGDFKISVCARCNGEKRIKTTDPVLFRVEWKDCPGCRDEIQPAPNVEKIAQVWADFDLDFFYWK
jgi:hypothetical protein